MTPQERRLLDELFDRLARLESAPRDPDAVAAINEGLERAPNALYPLVQTALVQDEALRRADARIRELESELGIQPGQAPAPGGFLDNMRDALLGRREPQGSVPSVRQDRGGDRWGNAPGQAAQPPQQPYGYPPGAAPAAPGGFGGGSFLGTAAATAAGVVGGALLAQSFRGMFGNQAQAAGAFDQGGGGTPWGSGGGDLAREAGINDIGRGDRAGAYQDPGSDRAGLFDTAAHDADQGDADFDSDFGGDMGGGDFGGGD
jgi:hypothetical protein